MSLAPGTVVGHYRIESTLGSGGNGVVYRARDLALDRTVALKLLHSAGAGAEEESLRLMREAKAAAALDHPHICTVFEVGSYLDRPFIAMQYVEGETLQARIARGPIPYPEARRYALQIADALASAHAHGIVHRDLKPSNLLLARGQVLLLDFGLAKSFELPASAAAHGATPLATLTQAGMMVGTPGYMAPEQMVGARVDARADIFSFGVVLYEMLSGRNAFLRDRQEDSLAAVLGHDLMPLRALVPELPAEVEHLVQRCLEAAPSARYASAIELLAALERLPGGAAAEAGGSTATPAPTLHLHNERRNGGIGRVVSLSAALAGVLALGLWLLWPAAERGSQRVSPAEAAPTTSQSTASDSSAAALVPDKTIAVLAFADLSPGGDHEYFADGIAEEILNALVKVPGLRVAGRTSAFHFKGRNVDLREIGKSLEVAHILEGSVRKQGEKVRITAQLIRSDDGFHLWSETYDGDLADVFALQERIARAITGKLELVLSGRQAQRLVEVGTANSEAYALYLQASAIFNRRDGAHFGEALAKLDQAIVLDPNYARAHARLASLHAVAGGYLAIDFGDPLPAVERHMRQAIAIDPGLAEPHAAYGIALSNQRRYREALAMLARAVELDPHDANAHFWYGIVLTMTGYRSEGDLAFDRTLAIDPLSPIALYWRVRNLVDAGDLESAERLLLRMDDLGFAAASAGRAVIARTRGDTEAALEPLTRTLQAFTRDFPPGAARSFARACLGDAEAKAEALALIDELLATGPQTLPGVVPYVLLLSGEARRALELARDRHTTNDTLLFPELATSTPSMRELRRTPEFAEFARRSGLVALWDDRGPPDLCRKSAEGGWACD